MRDGDDTKSDVRGDHGEIAVRQVDDLHDTEHQRQAAREQRVQATEHDALKYCIDPGHARTPKYASSIWPPVSEAGGPASVIRPSSRQCTCDATASAWLTSCSTTRIVTPDAASFGSSA